MIQSFQLNDKCQPLAGVVIFSDILLKLGLESMHSLTSIVHDLNMKLLCTKGENERKNEVRISMLLIKYSLPRSYLALIQVHTYYVREVSHRKPLQTVGWYIV